MCFDAPLIYPPSTPVYSLWQQGLYVHLLVWTHWGWGERTSLMLASVVGGHGWKLGRKWMMDIRTWQFDSSWGKPRHFAFYLAFSKISKWWSTFGFHESVCCHRPHWENTFVYSGFKSPSVEATVKWTIRFAGDPSTPCKQWLFPRILLLWHEWPIGWIIYNLSVEPPTYPISWHSSWSLSQ